jgi:putative endonuclease
MFGDLPAAMVSAGSFGFETYDDPVNAISREKEIKKWRRAWKLRLIEQSNSQWVDLYDQISQ